MVDNGENIHKHNNEERRLRLRKSYKESIDKVQLSDDSNIKDNKNNTASTSQPEYEDDSILDFKSPKRTHTIQSKNKIYNTRLIDKSKKKVPPVKVKIINTEKKLDNGKLSKDNKILHDKQLSIESSFFKTEKKTDSIQSSANIKIAYVCPLCFKNFKDENLQTIHIKSCATKNNVSTKKLLNAMELQERQAAERKSLGLLSAPILQERKKPASFKMAHPDDPDLQLALALSKSLYEREEIWDEAEIVAISSCSSLPDGNKEHCQRSTLQNFGFTSSRSISPTYNYPTNKIKRKRLVEPTILQKRTTVEREHILTERISEILMGYEDFTQKFQDAKEQSNIIKKKMVVKSHLLQQLHQSENTLWDKTSLISNQNIFYVKQLLPQITSVSKKEQASHEEQNIIDQNVKNERFLIKEEMKEIKEMQTTNTDNKEKLTFSPNAVNACCKEKKYLDSLATNWGNILNDSTASDIIIFVKDNRHIWTHKLVFYVRCTNILLDITSNDTESSNVKEKISWIDTDYDVALAFLEFVYCGIINKYLKVLDSDASLSAVRALARKYKVTDLFVYLRQKELKSNLAEAKFDYNTYERNIEDTGMEKVSNASNINKLSFVETSDYTYDSMNVQYSPKPLQKDVNNILLSPEDNHTSAENIDAFCIMQDGKPIFLESSELLNSRNKNTSINERSPSPDMFDDTPNIVEYDDKSIAYSKDHEDSDIQVLLSLIKQDTDINMCSQKSSIEKTHDARHSELGFEDVSICLKNIKQNVMEIDSNSGSNSLKPSTDDSHDPLTLESTLKSIQDSSPNIIKPKSDLTMFIEKIQRANAKSDSDLDSDPDIEACPVSPMSYLNPFYKNKYEDSDNADLESYNDNIKQSATIEKKNLGKLSMIEQRMQSYANENPEFYSRPPDKLAQNIEQTNALTVSPERTTKSSSNSIENYIHNFTSPVERDINTSEQITSTPSPPISYVKITNQSLSESTYDLESDKKDISMYSEYMRNCKNNSIAKYRAEIKASKSDDNLFNRDTSFDLTNKTSDMDKNDEVMIPSILIQKDIDIIVSSDTEVESLSSNIGSPVVLQNDDSNHEIIISHSMQQSERIIEDNKQDIQSEENNKSLRIQEMSKTVTMDLEKEKDINYTIKLSESKSINIDREMTSNNADFFITFTKTKSELNKSSKDIVTYNTDFLNAKNSLLDMKYNDKNIIETGCHKKKKSAEFSFNFEDDIYLANVDVDKYEKQDSLGKTQSSTFNTVERDRNVTTLTQNSTNIRKLKKKSLSEGQINSLYNQKAVSRNIPAEISYNQNIKNVKIASKIVNKDVTPPPDYNNMSTPELHKEMKTYGLKIQKRSRAVKLLTHIYNELHPIVPVAEATTEQEINEILSDEDEGPPLKKRNIDDKNLDYNMEDGDNELPCSQDSNKSTNSMKDIISKEMEFYETESLPILNNLSDIKEVFLKLIDSDKKLYNNILRYEPVNIEKLYSTLRGRGFKCKFSNLMSFLDEQCITFYAPEQNIRSKTHKKA